MERSLRDEMNDRIDKFLNNQCHGFGFRVLFDELVPELCEVIFDVLKMEPDSQDQSYKEFVSKRNYLNKIVRAMNDKTEIECTCGRIPCTCG